MIEYVATFKVAPHLESTNPADLEHVRFTSQHDCYNPDQMDDVANDAHTALNAVMHECLGYVVHDREWVSCMPAKDFDTMAAN